MAMDINQNLGNIMKEAQKMQQNMQEAQQALTQATFEGKAGGGMVTITLKGNYYPITPKGCKINPALLEEDVEMLQDLVVAAINDAVRQIEAASREKISQLTAGLNIPTDFLKDANE